MLKSTRKKARHEAEKKSRGQMVLSSFHERGGGQGSEINWGDKASYILKAGPQSHQKVGCIGLALLLTLDAPKCGRKTAMASPREEPGSRQGEDKRPPQGRSYTGSDGCGIRVHNGDRLTSIY